MEESSTPGGKPMNLDLAGGQPFKRPSNEREFAHSLQDAGVSGEGRYLCWWMAVLLGRGQMP